MRIIGLISVFSEVETIIVLAKNSTVTATITIEAKRISGSLKISKFCVSFISRMNNDFDKAKIKNRRIIPSTIKIFVSS